MRLSLSLAILLWSTRGFFAAPGIEIEQITFGPQHHFFGYIGHVQNIPWNQSGRYIVALETDFQDHLPKPNEAASIVLIDVFHKYRVRVVDQTRAWNHQQGTMLYWNPSSPNTQFFFNDRDADTGKVFCVLFDISLGPSGRRIHEFRYEDTPFGNSGVAQKGGVFLGLNYGRLARLRPVTGYPEAYDWTENVQHPKNDGIFKVDVATHQKQLLVSYRRLGDALRDQYPDVDGKALFINHTLWNRDDDRIYFYVRGNFGRGKGRLDVPFTIDADGTGLRRQSLHIGGHPEWALGHRIIGSYQDRQVIYDTDQQKIVGQLGNERIFPKPGGDIALSPRADWFVNGYADKGSNCYVLLRRSDSAHVRSRRFDRNNWTSGPLRIDPAPCWNRDGTQVVFPAIADDAKRTRQMFLIRLRAGGG